MIFFKIIKYISLLALIFFIFYYVILPLAPYLNYINNFIVSEDNNLLEKSKMYSFLKLLKNIIYKSESSDQIINFGETARNTKDILNKRALILREYTVNENYKEWQGFLMNLQNLINDYSILSKGTRRILLYEKNRWVAWKRRALWLYNKSKAKTCRAASALNRCF